MGGLIARAMSAMFGGDSGESGVALELGAVAAGKQVVTQVIATAAPMPEGPKVYRWSIHFATHEEMKKFHELVLSLVSGARSDG